MPIAQAKNVEVEVDAGDGVCFNGHEIDGVTLLKNLIGNAIRYTPPGGAVMCCAEQVSGELKIRIEDGGPGIAPAERERVFDPFYRVIGSSDTGSGLGLAIVRAIVDRMHGRITLDNMQQGAQVTGLCVTLVLPLRG